MKLRIECALAQTLAEEFLELAGLTDQLRFGQHAETRLRLLSLPPQQRGREHRGAFLCCAMSRGLGLLIAR